jgi:hypothetical protein
MICEYQGAATKRFVEVRTRQPDMLSGVPQEARIRFLINWGLRGSLPPADNGQLSRGQANSLICPAESLFLGLS